MPQYPVAAPVAPPGPQNAPRPDPGARGFRVDGLQMERPAQIDPRGFVAEAGANYGEAIQAVGKEATKLYQAHVDSVTKEQVLNAEAGLEAARMNIAAKLAGEKNTLKWQELAAGEAQKFQQEVLSDKDLTPAAKAQITNLYNRWQVTEVAGVNLQAAQVQSKRTAEALGGAVIDAQRRGDFATAGTLIKKGRQENILGDDVGAHMETVNGRLEKEAAQVQRKENINAFVRTAEDPKKAAEELQAGKTPKGLEGLTGEERAYTVNRLQEQYRENRAATVDDLTQQAASGMWKIPEEVTQYAKDHPEKKILPSDVMHAQRIVAELGGLSAGDRKAAMEANAEGNLARGLAAVRQYDAASDTDLKSYNQIQSWVVRNVPARLHSVILPGLKQKIGKPGGEPGNPQMKIIQDELDGKMKLGYKGGFGTFANNVPVPEDIIDPNTGEVTGQKYVKSTEVNRDAYIRAENARVKVETHMYQWLQGFPPGKPPTKPEIMTEMDRVMPTATAAAGMDLLYRTAAPLGLAPSTGEPAKKPQEFDLPEPKVPPARKYSPLEMPESGKTAGAPDNNPKGALPGKNPDGGTGNKEAPLSQDDEPNNPGGPSSALLPDLPPSATPSMYVPDPSNKNESIELVPLTAEWLGKTGAKKIRVYIQGDGWKELSRDKAEKLKGDSGAFVVP